METMFRAYFEQGKDLSKPEELLSVARLAGVLEEGRGGGRGRGRGAGGGAGGEQCAPGPGDAVGARQSAAAEGVGGALFSRGAQGRVSASGL